jgi:LysM repeat protein
MGLIDFIKNAGQQIGLVKAEAPEAASEEQPAVVSPEEIERLRVRRLGAAIVAHIEKLGLEVDELSVRVDADVATVSGTVASQELREKVILAAGNVQGIAQVDDRLQVEAPEPEATMYTVQSGDTLWKIAEDHYGDGSKYGTIFEANKPLLTDPDKIYPGQVLRIPPAG